MDSTCGAAHPRMANPGLKPRQKGAAGPYRSAPGPAGVGAEGLTAQEDAPYRSGEFPAARSVLPFEVIPVYHAGSYPDSCDFPSQDVSCSGCSSVAYSFAPIMPTIRDRFTDLEEHGITRQEETLLESARAWPYKCTAFANDEHPHDLVSRLRAEDTARDFCPRGKCGIDAEALARKDAKIGVAETCLHCTSSSSSSVNLDQQTLQRHSECRDALSYDSDLTLRGGFPAKEVPAPKDVALPGAGPNVAFWDVDSRGSTGLNFVFEDDCPSRQPRRGPDDRFVSSNSTTMDSVTTGSAKGRKVLVASSVTSRETALRKDARSKQDFGQKIYSKLEVDGSHPFYDADRCFKASNAAGDGDAGSYDVSVDFVSNTVSADQALSVRPGQSRPGNAVPASAQTAGSEFLKGFLKNQAAGQQQPPVVKNGWANSQTAVAHRCVDLPSRDNRSRSFSDSESEFCGQSVPRLAVYQNQLYEQRRGSCGVQRAYGRGGGFEQRQRSAAMEEPPSPPPTSADSGISGVHREHGRSGTPPSASACEGGVSQISFHVIECIADSAPSPPRGQSSERCSSSCRTPIQEIEAVDDDNRSFQRRRRDSPSSHLYDSSQSWMCQVVGNRPLQHANSNQVCTDGKKLRKYQHLPLVPLVTKGLGKLLMCFRG